MKSVVQAAWLLTTALGDVIVVIVAGVKLFSQVGTYLQGAAKKSNPLSYFANF